MAGTKVESFFHSAFPTVFPDQLCPHSCVEHPGQGKTKKVFSCFSFRLFSPSPDTSLFFGSKIGKKKKGGRGKGMSLKDPKLPHKKYYLGRKP